VITRPIIYNDFNRPIGGIEIMRHHRLLARVLKEYVDPQNYELALDCQAALSRLVNEVKRRKLKRPHEKKLHSALNPLRLRALKLRRRKVPRHLPVLQHAASARAAQRDDEL